MNCFMSYNPNVAHEVKVTTWIKEFDGASPVYPSFPNEGDVFIVFDNDEATEPSVNKTFSSGDWADTESDAPTGTIEITENGEGIDVSSYAYADVNVSGGGMDMPTFTVVTSGCTASCDKTYAECEALIEGSGSVDSSFSCIVKVFVSGEEYTLYRCMQLSGETIVVEVNKAGAYISYEADGTITYTAET